MVGDPVEQDGHVPPRQLGNRLLPNCLPEDVGERTHVPQIAFGQPPHPRKRCSKIVSQPGDDPGAPALLGLAVQISRPIRQYRAITSVFTARAACTRAARTWALTCSSRSPYPAGSTAPAALGAGASVMAAILTHPG
jgi:hypothetical protein